jgi:hypothetical protein
VQLESAVYVAQPALESGNSHRLAFGGHGRFTRVRVNRLDKPAVSVFV